MEIKVTLQNLLKELNIQGLLSNTKFQNIQTNQNEIWPPDPSPWFIKLLMVFGAWIASVFFIITMFLTELLRSESSFFVCGLLWIIISVLLSRASKQFFLAQLALSMSVAGHLMVFGSLIAMNNNPFQVVIAAIILAIALYIPYSDPVHRFLSPLSALATIAIWIHYEKLYPLFHLLLAFELIATAVLFTNPKIKSMFRPLAYAFAVSLSGTLLLNLLISDSQAFLFRRFFSDTFWIKTYEGLINKIIFAVGLIWLYQWVAGGLGKLKKDPLRIGVIATIFLGLISTPGILIALWLMILGYTLRDRILIGLSIAFFPIFISLFYYNLDVTLDIKAYALLGSGIIFLIVRLGLKKFKLEEVEKLNITSSFPSNFRSHSLWSTVGVLVLILFVVNGLVVQKQSVLESGQTILLRLAPVDPRSLIQGDYMVLSYDLYNQFSPEQLNNLPYSGKMVVKLDNNSVATFLRFHQNKEIGKNEQILSFHIKKDIYSPRMKIGAESFFFQEGQADRYNSARYGELKVDANGNTVLIGLRGENFEPLGVK